MSVLKADRVECSAEYSIGRREHTAAVAQLNERPQAAAALQMLIEKDCAHSRRGTQGTLCHAARQAIGKTAKTKKLPELGIREYLPLVAGAGFEPATFRL